MMCQNPCYSDDENNLLAHNETCGGGNFVFIENITGRLCYISDRAVKKVGSPFRNANGEEIKQHTHCNLEKHDLTSFILDPQACDKVSRDIVDFNIPNMCHQG